MWSKQKILLSLYNNFIHTKIIYFTIASLFSNLMVIYQGGKEPEQQNLDRIVGNHLSLGS